ncbi:oxidative stress-induced growth inhibitor 2-like [Paramacrobiotus metropolitanus]|uniref:oxidative stress-induced growth inhibitor 2-like n=1 Tax=Paramacrobiotus metropolitanus TaxID=2943436 RepID=UPI002445A77E|nr:oxidative stress-induced growth inhibitor 2-like [Paramacrobiotus metropolitanus]XP_055354305.1 oxidative stress-induced growth inhibitor 2-like [Paramacrobiotus metropolitanus]XP_055354312.1 oxidative stress-induced growth inhibitor 2-like [Paramacrobiotus metropolitanus]
MKTFVVAPAVHGHVVPPATSAVHSETTDVAVIGNGPSALTLSFILNGNWPYYNGSHPDEIIHARLNYYKNKSILETDFGELSSGVSGQSRNLVANLFDQLLHPSTVYGDVDLTSCVSWKPVDCKVPHLILGPHPPGGAWQKMHGSKKALSFNNWLELPGLPLEEWVTRKGCCLRRRFPDNSRLPLAVWKHYYEDYPHEVGLEDSLRTGYYVTSVRNLAAHGDAETGENVTEDGENLQYPWEIKGERIGPDGEPEAFLIHAKKVVLATGTAENPKQLHVIGEHRSWTGHTYDDMHNFIADNLHLDEHGENTKKAKRCWSRVVIVGSGLTAADAVVEALTAGCHVYHIFDPKHSILSQLSERLYPDYAAIWKLMNGETRAQSTNFTGHYTPFPYGQVEKITSEHTVCVESQHGKKICLNKIEFVAVLVGSSPQLSYLNSDISRKLPIKAGMPLDSKRNPVAIDQLTHESIYQPGLFALGPLCGDNYVRFIPGGCVAAARSLIADLTRCL